MIQPIWMGDGLRPTVTTTSSSPSTPVLLRFVDLARVRGVETRCVEPRLLEELGWEAPMEALVPDSIDLGHSYLSLIALLSLVTAHRRPVRKGGRGETGRGPAQVGARPVRKGGRGETGRMPVPVGGAIADGQRAWSADEYEGVPRCESATEASSQVRPSGRKAASGCAGEDRSRLSS
jgi:hypothetical protein